MAARCCGGSRSRADESTAVDLVSTLGFGYENRMRLTLWKSCNIRLREVVPGDHPFEPASHQRRGPVENELLHNPGPGEPRSREDCNYTEHEPWRSIVAGEFTGNAVYDIVAIVSCLAEPDDDIRGRGVYLVHVVNLLRLFRGTSLIDTDGINPKG